MSNVFPHLAGQKYLSLVTFRKNGAPVPTPVWFAEDQSGTLYVMTNPKLGKVKRIRRNPRVEVAPSDIRGKVTGPAQAGTARILTGGDARERLKLIRKKYWLARIPLIWSRSNVVIEIEPASGT